MAFDFSTFIWTDPSWKFNGTRLQHAYEVAAANCRTAKTVYDIEIDVIVSECVSKDSCAPFIKNYHKWAVQVTAYEVIAGIGLGCLMGIMAYNFTRRDSLTDAGNNALAGDALDSIAKLFTFFGTPDSAGSAIHGKAFPVKAFVGRACPDV